MEKTKKEIEKMETKKRRAGDMTNEQFNEFLETIASIVENSESTKEAAEKARKLKSMTK